MRTLVVLLALVSLVVRWADAACGCPHHNGWVTLFAAAVGSAEHGGHGCDAPAYEHSCCSEGRAVFAGGARVLVSDGCGMPPALVSPVLRVAAMRSSAVEERAIQPGCTHPSRAALQVWRI